MPDALELFFRRFGGEAELRGLRQRRECGEDGTDIRRQVLDWLEPALWRMGPDATLLELQQALYRELEQRQPADDAQRHDILVVIPVADRPRHLEQCLGSLLEQCRRYGYGGLLDGCYRRVSVLVADDSIEPSNMQRHREVAERFSDAGPSISAPTSSSRWWPTCPSPGVMPCPASSAVATGRPSTIREPRLPATSLTCGCARSMATAPGGCFSSWTATRSSRPGRKPPMVSGIYTQSTIFTGWTACSGKTTSRC